MAAIFISYNHKDERIAGKIKDWLSELRFERTYFACDLETGNKPGEQWEQRLYQELSRCHAIVLVLTGNWLDSKWCWAEMVLARALGKKIIQVICSPLGDQMVLPEIQAVDLLDWNDTGLQRLERGLREITNELARGFVWDVNKWPFPGMKAFEPEDAAIYFGRDDETNSLKQKLEAARTVGGASMLVITGGSGAGKSSLLKAGLVPQLRRTPREWLVLPIMRPDKAPMEMLSKSLAHSIKSSDWQAWHKRLMRSDAIESIARLLDELRVGDCLLARVLLPIDQLEELFTVSVPAERESFVRLLASALRPDRHLPLSIVATARADLLEHLLDTGELARVTETFHLAPITLERVPKLIEGPATTAALHVDKGLIDEIRRDLQRAEALPLLSHALSLLYSDERTLSLAKYQSLGDRAQGLNPLQNSVRLVADGIIKKLKPGKTELDALRDAFVPHLVRVRLEDGGYVRQSAVRSQLPQKSRILLDALVRERLLVIRAPGGGSSTQRKDAVIEVAHEALFTAWPTLNEWLKESQAFLLDLERIKAAYGVWMQAPNDQKIQALLGGLLLSRAREWLRAYPRRFVGLEMKALGRFIDASACAEDAELERREQEKREHEQKVQEQRDKALLAQSLFLVASAQGHIDAGDACTGVLLALEALPEGEGGALDRPYCAEAELALFRGVHRLLEVAVLNGHGGAVHSADFSADGRHAVTASHDHTAQVWNLQLDNPCAVVTLRGHSGPVLSAAFSPDGRSVVTASWDASARVWEVTGREIAVLRGHSSRVANAQFSPDGLRIVTASDDGTARVWDAKHGTEVAVLRGRGGRITSAQFSPDRQFVITGSDDQIPRLWEAETGKELHMFEGHDRCVTDARFSPDGERIVTASEDATARLWNAFTGEREAVFKGHDDTVISARFSSDGARIVTASWDKTARIWTADTGECLFTLRGHSLPLSSACFGCDGQRVLTASHDGTARAWNVATGEPEAIFGGHDEAVTAASFSPDERHVLTASTDATARLWKSRNAPLRLLGHEGAVAGAVFSSDGRRVMTVSEDKTARVWSAAAGDDLAVLRHQFASVNTGAFSPNGELVVTGASDNTLRLWDSTSGNEKGVIEGHNGRVLDVAFSSDGLRLLTASADRTVRLWEVASHDELAVLRHAAPVRGAVFSPDERLVLTACDDRMAYLWEMDKRSPSLILQGHENAVTSARFSPDGKRIVTASTDTTCRLWNLEGHELAIVQNADSALSYSEFSPDDLRIVTAGADGIARLWAAQTASQVEPWKAVAELEGHKAALSTAKFSPDGGRVLTASRDGSARIWDVFPSTQVIVEHARRLVPRCLAQVQRKNAFLDLESPAWCIEMSKWPSSAVG
jgi:WD40 repeat protein